MDFAIEGVATPPPDQPGIVAWYRVVSADYMSLMGMRLRSGRLFNGREADPVVVISKTLATRYWKDADPVGRRVRFGSNMSDPWFTIVGVVGDVHHTGLDKKPEPELYFPYEQNTWSGGRFVVRTTVAPSTLAAALRREVMSVDKDQPVVDVKPLTEMISESVAQPRFYMILLGAFSAVGLVLALVGIYGVVSYAVTERTHEIGVRLALGARPLNVMRMVLGQGLRLTLVGVAVGLAASFALTRVLSTLLYGVSATDAATFVAIPLLLLATATLASYVPARRATRVDPCVALRLG
jgi:putative ABC transport system permease protein